MSKMKVPATQDDELFVLKCKHISESTKKTIEIHDFIKKIEDQDNNLQVKTDGDLFRRKEIKTS